jgi:antitoxin (DNA-binding transcriptional repressor) of toxin-antitoxin stability system
MARNLRLPAPMDESPTVADGPERGSRTRRRKKPPHFRANVASSTIGLGARPRVAGRADTVAILDMVASGSYYRSMRAVGLKVLKNKLSEYVRLAAGGESVLVTDRDRVVAELVPPQAGRSLVLGDAMLAEAVRKGWLSPPLLPGRGAPPRLPSVPLRDLLHELEEDRGGR